MSAELVKAARVRVPNDIGRTANDYGCRLYTVTTSAQANALPDSWGGRWIIIRNVGSVEAHFAFSRSSSAAINTSPTATAAGATDQVASRIAAGEVQQRQLPAWDVSVETYFVRKSSAATELLLELGDGE